MALKGIGSVYWRNNVACMLSLSMMAVACLAPPPAPPPHNEPSATVPATAHDTDAGHVLSAEEIKGVVLANLDPFRACYESEASRTPTLKGEVTLVFQIAPAGNVSDVRVKRSSLANPAAEKCMVEAARSLRFPTSVQRSVVEWPFRFGIPDGDGGR
jgi:TonB family protein